MGSHTLVQVYLIPNIVHGNRVVHASQWSLWLLFALPTYLCTKLHVTCLLFHMCNYSENSESVICLQIPSYVLPYNYVTNLINLQVSYKVLIDWRVLDMVLVLFGSLLRYTDLPVPEVWTNVATVDILFLLNGIFQHSCAIGQQVWASTSHLSELVWKSNICYIHNHTICSNHGQGVNKHLSTFTCWLCSYVINGAFHCNWCWATSWFMSKHSTHYRSPFMPKLVNDRFCTGAMVLSKKLWRSAWPIKILVMGLCWKLMTTCCTTCFLLSAYNGDIWFTVVGMV